MLIEGTIQKSLAVAFVHRMNGIVSLGSYVYKTNINKNFAINLKPFLTYQNPILAA